MKILCVLYDDPKGGMPKSYPIKDLPKLEKYPDGMTLPSPKGRDFNPGELLGCVSAKEKELKSKEEEQNRKDIDLKVREEEQKNLELKEKRRKERALKIIKEEETKQKELEYIKIKEWEEKFDREQKAKEHRENLREQRLKQKELEKLGAFEDGCRKYRKEFFNRFRFWTYILYWFFYIFSDTKMAKRNSKVYNSCSSWFILFCHCYNYDFSK